MARRALTATQVSALNNDGVHWIAPSLYLQIRNQQGTRSYLFRYGRDGENQWLGLGSVADKPLSEARDEAAELRALVRRGGDPLADREQRATSPKKAKPPTFAECAQRYIEAHSPGWKNEKHIAQWESTIRMYVNPVIGKLPVDKVGVDHVMKVLEPIWTSKPETASRLRGRIEKVLGWATAMKHRTGDNPAAWDGALSHLLPPLSKVRKIEHHKAMETFGFTRPFGSSYPYQHGPEHEPCQRQRLGDHQTDGLAGLLLPSSGDGHVLQVSPGSRRSPLGARSDRPPWLGVPAPRFASR